jgi:RNA polymerase sigma-70 factor (ECF subfamily)
MFPGRVHGSPPAAALSDVDPAETFLVRRAAAGDRSAFAGLIEAHWARLVRLARSVVGEAEAEDSVQEALLRAWLALPSLRRPEAFSPWLTRVVLRGCFRDRRRRPETVPLTEVPEPAAAPAPGAGLDVERLLAALAPRQRAVMHLTAVEGMSDGEIGALMEITPAAVRSHRRRAREALSRLLGTQAPTASSPREVLS